MGIGANRYLVCDNPLQRFAIALRHDDLAPFTTFALGGLPADVGYYEGVGTIHLGKPLEWDRTNCGVGKLGIERDHAEMLVRDVSGRTFWRTNAYGWGGAAGMYEEWAFMVDEDSPFFGDGW